MNHHLNTMINQLDTLHLNPESSTEHKLQQHQATLQQLHHEHHTAIHENQELKHALDAERQEKLNMKALLAQHQQQIFAQQSKLNQLDMELKRQKQANYALVVHLQKKEYESNSQQSNNLATSRRPPDVF